LPRPLKIEWTQRIDIFLEFRRLGKVYPVAKNHNVARSTVDAIVREFISSGFSRQPRPALSPNTLSRIQDQHVGRLIQRFEAPAKVQLTLPSDNARGGLAPVDALSEQAIQNLKEQGLFQVSEEWVWHLRGTRADAVIKEVQQAVSDFNLQCLTFWLELAKTLSALSGLPVRPWRDWDGHSGQPQIFHYLVDSAYQEAFRATASSGEPALGWPHWSSEPDPKVLRGKQTECAIGDPADQEKVKLAVAAFVEQEFQGFVRPARELDMLYRDLQYLQDILDETLGQVDKLTVAQGICPGCPYPEAARPPVDRVPGNQNP